MSFSTPRSPRLPFRSLLAAAVLLTALSAHAQAGLTKPDPAALPFEAGTIVQGGKGITDLRDDFKFLMVGAHAGKTLTANHGAGPLRGSFEYAAELFPFWQSYTPRTPKSSCFPDARLNTAQVPNSSGAYCTDVYTIGGTFTGVSVTPIILRWNFAGTHRLTPWAQAAGGLLWTNHKYPAYGNTDGSLANNGPGADASVWNFTPQGGVGLHYFLTPRRSIDFGANAVHISSASLGDRNPGVNASVQFNVGYTWWK